MPADSRYFPVLAIPGGTMGQVLTAVGDNTGFWSDPAVGTGPVGPTGPTGPVGPAGAAGTPGSQILTGSVSPTGGLGNVGDFYINNTTGEYYQKTGPSTWSLQGVLALGVTSIMVPALTLGPNPGSSTAPVGGVANATLNLPGWAFPNPSTGNWIIGPVGFPVDWHTYSVAVLWSVETYTPSHTNTWRFIYAPVSGYPGFSHLANVDTINPTANIMLSTALGTAPISGDQNQFVGVQRLGAAFSSTVGVYGLLLTKVS